LPPCSDRGGRKTVKGFLDRRGRRLLPKKGRNDFDVLSKKKREEGKTPVLAKEKGRRAFSNSGGNLFFYGRKEKKKPLYSSVRENIGGFVSTNKSLSI